MSTRKRRRGDLDGVRAYVAILQPLLRIAHWDLVVGEEQAPDAMADCSTYVREHRAELRFSDHFFAAPRERQRQVMIHELLHVVTEEWHRSNLAAFEALDSTPRSWATERELHEMEMCVDGLSRILAPYLPLPPGE